MDQTPTPTPPPLVSPPPVVPSSYSPPPLSQYSSVVVGSQNAEKGKGAGKGAIIAGISVLLLGGLVFGVTKFTGLFSKATGEDNCIPSAVREDQITANSATIVFQTSTACQVEVSYGTSSQPEALLLQIPEGLASMSHSIRLSPLLPSTTYYYQIKVGGKPVGDVRNFLTALATGEAPVQPTQILTQAPNAGISPTTQPNVPTQDLTKGTLTFSDFQVQFGSNNKDYDIDKNGIVNFGDWTAYQKTQAK